MCVVGDGGVWGRGYGGVESTAQRGDGKLPARTKFAYRVCLARVVLAVWCAGVQREKEVKKRGG